jgi:hypothetical protein
VEDDAIVDTRSASASREGHRAPGRPQRAERRGGRSPRARARGRPRAIAACSRPFAACPIGWRSSPSRRRPLLRRLEGHQRRRRRHGALGLGEPRAVLIAGGRDKAGATRRSSMRSAQKGAPRSSSAKRRRHRRRHRRRRPRPRAPRCATRSRERAPRAPRRRGAPLARLLQLRHVPRLQAPGRRVRPREVRARGASRGVVSDPAQERPPRPLRLAPRSTPPRGPTARGGPLRSGARRVVVALIGFGVVMVYSASPCRRRCSTTTRSSS